MAVGLLCRLVNPKSCHSCCSHHRRRRHRRHRLHHHLSSVLRKRLIVFADRRTPRAPGNGSRSCCPSSAIQPERQPKLPTSAPMQQLYSLPCGSCSTRRSVRPRVQCSPSRTGVTALVPSCRPSLGSGRRCYTSTQWALPTSASLVRLHRCSSLWVVSDMPTRASVRRETFVAWMIEPSALYWTCCLID